MKAWRLCLLSISPSLTTPSENFRSMWAETVPITPNVTFDEIWSVGRF